MTKEDEIKKLKKIFYDPERNTSSVDRLFRASKNDGLDLTKADVKKFIEKQGAYQRTKTFVKPREFSSIIAPRVGSNLQADLIF